MREVDIIPDYLVVGLLRADKSNESSDRIAAQEVDGIWQHIDVGDMPVIVRSANRRETSVRNPRRRHTRGT